IIADRREALGAESARVRHAWAELGDAEYLDRLYPLLDRVVSAVAAVHAAGVLHRDIKPSNILVDAQGQAWLSDFGLARLAQGSRLTTTGLGLGTPGYMSPEQWSGEDVDFRSDIFSLGI